MTAARIHAGQKLGQTGEEHYLSFEKFPNLGLLKVMQKKQLLYSRNDLKDLHKYLSCAVFPSCYSQTLSLQPFISDLIFVKNFENTNLIFCAPLHVTRRPTT